MLIKRSSKIYWQNINKCIFGIGILFLLCACKQEPQVDGQLVANLNGDVLTKEDLMEMIPTKADPSQDDLRYYIDNWAKKTAFIQEAENSLENIDAIENAVQAYRKSLLYHHFSNQLVNNHLDTSISKGEIDSVYQKFRENYRLSEPIFKARWILIQEKYIETDSVILDWKNSKKYQKLPYQCELYASSYTLDTSVYWGSNAIESVFRKVDKPFRPSAIDLGVKKITSDENILFIDLIEKVPKGDIAPVQYIEEKLKKLILQKREERLIEDYKKTLLKEVVEKNELQLYELHDAP